MNRRAHHRRRAREASRTCLTASDQQRLDKCRRLPDDYPKIERVLKDRGERLSDKQLAALRRRVIKVGCDDAQPILACIRKSKEFRRWGRQLRSHPGPESRLPPDILLLAVILAADEKERVHRTVVCRIINGLDSRIWHSAGMCDNKTREPISFNTVFRQLQRIEPPTQLVSVPQTSTTDEELPMTDIDLLHDDEEKIELQIGSNFRRLMADICQATIPVKRLKDAKAISVDQTAFQTFYRSTQFSKQGEIDQLIAQGKDLPDDVQLGPDGKLIRCPDLDARAGHRSASAATGHKATEFTGYHTTFSVLTKPIHWSGKPDKLKEHPDVPPYILSYSVDPASNNVGHMSERVVHDALAIAPGIREVLADRGITQLGEAFVRPVHQRGLDVTMDLKSDMIDTKMITAGTGKHKQRLYTAEGAFYPLWLPEHFHEVPEGLTTNKLRKWYAKRASYRWSAAQRVDGGIQFQCAQCAGRIVSNLKTRRKNVRPTTTAPEIRIRNPSDDDPTNDAYHGTHYDDTCCKGLATIPYDMLDLWQPIPWETPAWKSAYNRRLQVENVNSMVKADGGLAPGFCRARGLGAHNLAVLALAVKHNLELAMTDPLAEDPDDESDDDHPDGTDDGSDAAADNGDIPAPEDDRGGHRLRAPP